MVESVSRQDEANSAFSLATRASKMGLFRRLGISRVGPARKCSFLVINKSFIDQACLVKMAVSALFFLAFS